MKILFDKSVFDFLNDLKKHNDRPWFLENKSKYESAKKSLAGFIDEIIFELNRKDSIETPNGFKSMQRIYRDLRFSRDQSPYKTHLAGRLKRATKQLRGGYYYHFEPGRTYISGGFYGPVADDLKRIRQEFSTDPDIIRKIITRKAFKDTFGTIQGDRLKNFPRGFAALLPGIDLIKHKQFILKRKFTDQEVLSPGFFRQMIDTYHGMRPFFDYMSWILTTDVNGMPLL